MPRHTTFIPLPRAPAPERGDAGAPGLPTAGGRDGRRAAPAAPPRPRGPGRLTDPDGTVEPETETFT